MRRERPIERRNPSGEIVWMARYTGRDGKRHIAKPTWNRGKGTFRRKSDAQKAIDEAYGLSDRPDTLGDYAATWTERHPRSERTNATNDHRISRVADVEIEGIPLKDWPLRELRRRHTLALVDHMLRTEGRATTGAVGILRALSAMAEDAITDEVCDLNPFKGVRIRANDPRAQKKPRPIRVFSFEEMHRFAKAAGRYEAMVRVFTDCGLRLGEVLPLRREDFDGEALQVRRTAHEGQILEGTKTDHGEPDAGRVVPVPATLAWMLEAQINLNGPDCQLLFPTPRGRLWRERTFYHDLWKPAQGASGLDMRPHECRHSYVTHLRAAGVNDADLAEIVGHRVETMLARYTHAVGKSFDVVRGLWGESAEFFRIWVPLSGALSVLCHLVVFLGICGVPSSALFVETAKWGMSTQDEIFKWVQEFEPWKQELFRRSSAGPDLSVEDVRQVADLLLGQGTTSSEPREVTRDELPDAEQQGEPMVVCLLSGLRNVNAIDDGQKIGFEPGLNVIYGRNGAGKTGYSRILKHAGRTLHRESVLTNVRDKASGGPSAVVTVRIGDKEEAIPLNLEAPGPAKLGRICIADADACDVYLTSDTEVDYVPASLASIRRFAAALKALDEELDNRRQDAIPTEIDTQIYGDTAVAKLLIQMTAKTPEASVFALADLSEAELARKAELTKQRGAIQASETPKLRLGAERDATSVQTLLDDLGGLTRVLNSEQLNARRGELGNLEALEKASTEAAKQFEGAPLEGIGSDPWRKLWEAARLYSEHISQEFPVDHDPASCPLCMQELSHDARQRLLRFEEFVQSNVNARLANAQRALKESLESLPDADAISARHSHAIELLGQGEGELGAQVVKWLVEAKVVIEAIRNKALDGIQGLSLPSDALDRWIESRRTEAERYAGLEKVEDQKAVINELAELEARHVLGERRQEVVDYLAGLRETAAIETAKGKLGRTAASRKLTDLSRALIEANIQDALNRQLKALDFSGLEVSAKSKSPGGKPKLGLKFKTVDKVPLTAVLSKGEQRRLSLAMFLAELEVISDPSPVVLDDPVSSIDQEGRRHIARTLLALAVKRQVIIFTHELSFIYELDRLAPAGLPVKVQQLRRRGKTVGHVFPDVPWQGLKAKQRVGPLHEKLVAARGLHEASEEEKYEAAATEYCLLLREAFERAVEEGVLVDVVTRRKDTVHVLSLRKIRWSEDICELVERGTDENSPWVHDQPRGDGALPPTPDELSDGLDVLKELLAAIKAFKPGGKGSGSPPPKLKAVDQKGDSGTHQPAPTPLRIVDLPPATGEDSPAG